MDRFVQHVPASAAFAAIQEHVQQCEELIFASCIVGALRREHSMDMFQMRCTECGRDHDTSRPAYACSSCGNLLEIKVDLAKARDVIPKGGWKGRPIGVWRYKELLPVGAKGPVASLGEGGTPLIRCDRIAERLGLKSLWVKFDGANPTGSFKDRGMTVGITKARELDSKVVACASTGNTSASLAAYAALSGIRCVVLIPQGKIALGKLAQAVMHGAEVVAVEGNFDQALDTVMAASDRLGMYVLNSVNPYRPEGQKTAAYEVCDQLGGIAPRYLYIPVGNGGNSAAYWKGFVEYEALGLATGRPVIRGVQAEGAAPIARMLREGRDTMVPVSDPDTVATAIRIGRPANWRKTVRAIKESKGTASTVTDEEILSAQRDLARFEGIFAEPAGAAALAGLIKDVQAENVDRRAEIVCVSTGHGLKDPDTAISQCSKPRSIKPTVEALAALLGGA
jgi:threonine synthase